MNIDKNNPKTWVPFKQHLCGTCRAHCCAMPVEIRAADLLRLHLSSEEEIESEGERKVARQLMREGIVRSYREATGLFLLESAPDGSCVFLDGQRRCKVYEKRPTVCRSFPVEMGNRLGFCPYEHK